MREKRVRQRGVIIQCVCSPGLPHLFWNKMAGSGFGLVRRDEGKSRGNSVGGWGKNAQRFGPLVPILPPPPTHPPLTHPPPPPSPLSPDIWDLRQSDHGGSLGPVKHFNLSWVGIQKKLSECWHSEKAFLGLAFRKSFLGLAFKKSFLGLAFRISFLGLAFRKSFLGWHSEKKNSGGWHSEKLAFWGLAFRKKVFWGLAFRKDFLGVGIQKKLWLW